MPSITIRISEGELTWGQAAGPVDQPFDAVAVALEVSPGNAAARNEGV